MSAEEKIKYYKERELKNEAERKKDEERERREALRAKAKEEQRQRALRFKEKEREERKVATKSKTLDLSKKQINTSSSPIKKKKKPAVNSEERKQNPLGNILLDTVADISFSNKDHLVYEFAVRWHYALPSPWPPVDYDYR